MKTFDEKILLVPDTGFRMFFFPLGPDPFSVIDEDIRAMIIKNREACAMSADDTRVEFGDPERCAWAPNVTNYLMFTNHHDALAIREDGRRYFVLASPLQRPGQIAAIGGKAHFDRLYQTIRDNPGGLRAFFETWPISDSFDPEGRAPITRYLKELADNAASPLQMAVRHCIEDQPHPLVRTDLLSLGCLRGSLEGAHLPDFSDQALAQVLRELGWEKLDRAMIEGSKHQLWGHDYKGTNARQEAALRLEFL